MSASSSQIQKSLSHAVLAGDIRVVRSMLDQGADPNVCDPGDDAYPIHYAVNRGAEMVQLLIDHGADVNIFARGSTPLAAAEHRAFEDVVAVLRKAGARLSEHDEVFTMGTRFRLHIEPRIDMLVMQARIQYPTETPEQIANRVLPYVCQFPPHIPAARQDEVRGEIRTLILRACGVAAKLPGRTQPAQPAEIQAGPAPGKPPSQPAQPTGLSRADAAIVMQFWQTAGFREAQWFPGDPAERRWPTMAVLFDDLDQVKILFGFLRSKLGHVDHGDQLRIAVVEGPIPGKMPGYTLHISTGTEGAAQVLARGPVSPKLQAFKDALAKAKCFLLVPYVPNPRERGDWDALYDYAIERSQIHFRKARDVVRGDPDEAVLL